jgi:hypothetical protein
MLYLKTKLVKMNHSFFMQKIQKLQLNTIKILKNKDFWMKGGIFSILFLGCLILTDSVFAQDIEKSTEYANLEKEIINQLNQERVENNLKPLEFSSALKTAAGIKLKDLIKNEYFSHTSPEGVKAWDILADVGYEYKYAGENLAMKFNNAVDVHNAWMKSRTHKENILFENYTEVAVAIGKREKGSLVAVEFFGKPLNKIVVGKEIILESESGIKGDEMKIIANKVNDNSKYTGGTGNLLTQIAPDNKSIEKKSFSGIIPAKLSPDQIMSLNNMALLVVGVVCLILVVNIWVLEKEEERIVLEAKKVCSTKEVLVSG